MFDPSAEVEKAAAGLLEAKIKATGACKKGYHWKHLLFRYVLLWICRSHVVAAPIGSRMKCGR